MNEKKLEQFRKITKKALIANSIILVIMLFAYLVLFYVNSQRAKLIIDNVEVKNGEKTFVKRDKVNYVDVSLLFSSLNMFKINNGVYGETYESKDGFYIETPYEVMQFTNKTRKMYKTIIPDFQDRLIDKTTGKVELTEEEKSSVEKKPKPRDKKAIDNAIISEEEFDLKHPIIKEGPRVLVSFDDLKYILNSKVVQKGPELRIYSVEELEKKIARFLKNNDLSLSPLYQNRKSIIDDYFVASKSNNTFGVYKRDVQSNMIENIIGVQYEEIRYIQAEENIYFTTQDKKLGLKSLKNNEDIIKAGDYDALDIYYKEEGLYLAQKKGKYGVINNQGKVIVPIEYNQVGLIENKDKKREAVKKDDKEEENKLNKENKIIMDKFIPVMQNTTSKGEVWRLVVKDGSAQTDLNYTGIGYKVPTYVEPNEKGEIEIPASKTELARQLKIYQSRLNITDVRKIKQLGLTTNKNNIIDGAEDLLYIPKGYQDAGVIVEVYDPTEKINVNRYGIVRADFSKDNRSDEFVYPAVAERIYQTEIDGNIQYFAEVGNLQEEFVTGGEGRIKKTVSRENVDIIDYEEEKRKAREKLRLEQEEKKKKETEELTNDKRLDENLENEELNEQINKR